MEKPVESMVMEVAPEEEAVYTSECESSEDEERLWIPRNESEYEAALRYNFEKAVHTFGILTMAQMEPIFQYREPKMKQYTMQFWEHVFMKELTYEKVKEEVEANRCFAQALFAKAVKDSSEERTAYP